MKPAQTFISFSSLMTWNEAVEVQGDFGLRKYLSRKAGNAVLQV